MKAPKAPDPKETAAAQGQMNKETAIAQYGLNATNQVTPYGNLTYSQIGTWGDGTPRYQATQTLSPEQQNLYNLETQLSTNLGNIGVQQSGRLGSLLNSPVNLNNEATESRLMELGRSRLDPALDRRRSSTEQDLYNRGVRPGTEAYARAMEGVTQGENDAYNQLLLNGRSQAVNEALQERNQGINEIMALASGTQVQQPGYVNTPGSTVAPVDYTGLVNNKYNADVANYQAGMSGLFGLGSAALGGWAMSDERLKTDKEKVGETDDGINVYKYRFKGSPMMQMGVMAQEVKDKKPSAVKKTPSGFYAVNYDKVMR